MEIDADGRPRWQIDGLQQPLDVQLLPGDRLLIAEHSANQVTERNLRGEVLWEKRLGVRAQADGEADGPLVAQRLPNGNTFIATHTELLEVDRDGKEVND